MLSRRHDADFLCDFELDIEFDVPIYLTVEQQCWDFIINRFGWFHGIQFDIDNYFHSSFAIFCLRFPIITLLQHQRDIQNAKNAFKSIETHFYAGIKIPNDIIDEQMTAFRYLNSLIRFVGNRMSRGN